MAPFLRALISLVVLCTSIALPTWAQSGKNISPSSTGVNVSLTQSNNLDIQRLTREVGEARKKSDAWDRVTNFILLVGAFVGIGIVVSAVGSSRAKTKLINLQDDLTTAKETQLSLILQAGEENLEAERLARVEIEDSVAWRRLSDLQISDIGQALKVFTGSGAYFIYPQGDEEAASFTADIKTALCAANWQMLGSVSQVQIQQSGPEPPSACSAHRIRPSAIGVIVAYKTEIPNLHTAENSLRRRAALALVDKLSKLGFDTVPQPDVSGQANSLGVEDIAVMVRHRPEGPQGAAKLRHEKQAEKQSK